MANDRQVKWLPPGWVWVYKGEQKWRTSRGILSDERHATNILSGETLSTRQVQNLQKEERIRIGQPKSATQPREGKLKTQYKKTLKEKPYNLYSFRTLDDAAAWVMSGGGGNNELLISIRYCSTTMKDNVSVVSPQLKPKNGTVNLTGYTDAVTLRDREEIWENADDMMQEYFNMDCPRARVFIQERLLRR